MRGLNLAESKRLRKFNDVRTEVAKQHDLKGPDQVVDMAKIKITPELNVEIPNLGTYQMTDWAQRQLGVILGVQWNKWFDPSVVDHEHVQEEITRRFSKTGDARKLRTKRFQKGAPGAEGCDGYLRAVLSPTYHPIDDERVFDRLERQFGEQVGELNFMQNHLSKKASWGNDHCNHYTLVGEPINMGSVERNHPDPKVREAYMVAELNGDLPKEDLVYPGFHMRNSEVGYTAIIIDEFSFRLVCLNGMMITTGDSRLLYRQHRPIDDEVLDKQLTSVFNKVPTRWEATRKSITNAKGIALASPEGEIEDSLTKMGAPKHFREAAATAFTIEPLPTMFGVLQAITRAAQNYEDMDKRFEYEAYAGNLLSRVSMLTPNFRRV